MLPRCHLLPAQSGHKVPLGYAVALQAGELKMLETRFVGCQGVMGILCPTQCDDTYILLCFLAQPQLVFSSLSPTLLHDGEKRHLQSYNLL